MARSLVALAAITLGAISLVAQAPANAPAGSTGLCKDGTYSNAAHKTGACRGHQGVQTWFSSSTAAPAPAATPAATPASTPAPAPVARTTTAPAPAATPVQRTPASGGGPGMVWVNTSTKVYHCSGTKYYGTTKAGKYLTEAAAKAEGDRPDHGKTCAQ